jgi:hypothetical protein
MKNKHVGLHSHRLHPKQGNPLEVRFAKAWALSNEQGRTLDHLLNTTSSGSPPEASTADAIVAATVVQWLGSQVGQSFLCDVQGEPDTKELLRCVLQGQDVLTDKAWLRLARKVVDE